MQKDGFAATWPALVAATDVERHGHLPASRTSANKAHPESGQQASGVLEPLVHGQTSSDLDVQVPLGLPGGGGLAGALRHMPVGPPRDTMPLRPTLGVLAPRSYREPGYVPRALVGAGGLAARRRPAYHQCGQVPRRPQRRGGGAAGPMAVLLGGRCRLQLAELGTAGAVGCYLIDFNLQLARQVPRTRFCLNKFKFYFQVFLLA